MTMTEKGKAGHPGTTISTWSDAIRVYSEMKLDEAIRCYLNFARKGRLNGYPVINLWVKYDDQEQVYHAMSYLLERSLQQFSQRENEFSLTPDYYVELPRPSSDEMEFICQSLLYVRTRELLSITQTTKEYADKGALLTLKCSAHDDEVIEARERINSVLQHYKLPFISQRHLLPTLVVMALIIFVIIPEVSPSLMVGAMLEVGVCGALFINELWSNDIIKKEVRVDHVSTIKDNSILASLLNRVRESKKVLTVSDLLKARTKLIES